MGEKGRAWVMSDFAGLGKGLRFYTEYNETLLEGFKLCVYERMCVCVCMSVCVCVYLRV